MIDATLGAARVHTRVLASVRAHGKALLAGLLTAGAALALKHVSSRATVDELRFVLAPSCFFAELLGAPSLRWEPGAGFVSHEARMVVGVPCAGVSFLTIGWLALYFTCQSRHNRLASKVHTAVACLFAAYLAAVLANGTRIALAMQLHAIDFGAGFVTGDRVHRWLGVVVYCVALLLACGAAQRLAKPSSSNQAYVIAAAIYVAITAGVPVARHLLGAPDLAGTSRFAEHLVHTLATSTLVFLAAALARRLVADLSNRLSLLRAQPRRAQPRAEPLLGPRSEAP